MGRATVVKIQPRRLALRVELLHQAHSKQHSRLLQVLAGVAARVRVAQVQAVRAADMASAKLRAQVARRVSHAAEREFRYHEPRSLRPEKLLLR